MSHRFFFSLAVANQTPNRAGEMDATEQGPPNSVAAMNTIGPGAISDYKRLKILLSDGDAASGNQRSSKTMGCYRLLRQVGGGGFSKIYLGQHLHLKANVAVKVLSRSSFDSKTILLLGKEAEIMESMNHPHLLTLFQVIESLATTILVMEFAPQGDLVTLLSRKGKLSVERSSLYFTQIASGVHYMHSLGIVHRDIKADNIFIFSDHLVKLGDFGFSVSVAEGEKLRVFCGSVPYSAPELFETDEYDGKETDMWALGVILYFMVRGQLPFHAPSLDEIRMRVCDRNFTPPSLARIDSAISEVVQGLLQREPRERMTFDALRQVPWAAGIFTVKPLLPFALAAPPGVEHDKEAILAIENELSATFAALNSFGVDSTAFREDKEASDIHDPVGAVYRKIRHDVQMKAVEHKCASLAEETERGKDTRPKASAVCVLL